MDYGGGASYTTWWYAPGIFPVGAHFQASTSTSVWNEQTEQWEHLVIVTSYYAYKTVSVEEPPDDGGDGDGGGGGSSTPTIQITSVVSPSPGRSFISNRSRTGDRILLQASATANGQDISNLITWTYVGNEWGEFNTTTGASVVFVPRPNECPDGRSSALSYTIYAKISTDGGRAEDSVNLTQDRLDQLRQEYEDMQGRASLPRSAFDTASPFSPGLLGDGADAIIHGSYHILIPVNSHAYTTYVYYYIKYWHFNGIHFSSGYRCPIGNRRWNGENASLHQYGRAFDFDEASSKDNYDVYQSARDAGATYAYIVGNDGVIYSSLVTIPSPSQVAYLRGHAQWSN